MIVKPNAGRIVGIVVCLLADMRRISANFPLAPLLHCSLAGRSFREFRENDSAAVEFQNAVA